MTVRELIEVLNRHDPDALVYLPVCEDGLSGVAAFVSIVEHTNLPAGISIPPDITILPREMERFRGRIT